MSCRVILACLISLGVCFQGHASVVTLEPPCPMTQGMTDGTESAAQADAQHDCCTDAATFAKTGKLCKGGLASQPAGQAPMSVVAVAVPAPLTELRKSLSAPLIDSVKSAPLWRPPALI